MEEVVIHQINLNLRPQDSLFQTAAGLLQQVSIQPLTILPPQKTPHITINHISDDL